MTQRILLADDSATIRKVVELTFSDEDFAIDSVGDGSQALEHARAQRPDIIISDVIMPGLNGYELCQQCKADPDLKAVPFLFLKGTFESFDEEKARACGADGFVVKPFESQEMIAKVRDLIGRAAAAPAPVAVQSTPIHAATQPVAPRPLPQQRTVTAPPPTPAAPARLAPTPPAIPVQPARPAPPAIPVQPARPAPPAIPVQPARPAPPAIRTAAAPPAPPTPQWPTRPIPVAPLSEPPPPQPTPPIFQPPPPPPPPPPPAPAATTQAPSDEFGFDFRDAEDDRSGVQAAQPPVRPGASPVLETSGESDEDLWSEVSLRGGTSDFLEESGTYGSGGASGADILELSEEAALHAPEVLFEDEAVFEEITTARIAPIAPVVESPEPPEPPEPPEEPEETQLPSESLPAASSVPAAPVAIDKAEIERIVSSRVEAAVRQILEPVVGDLARTMIESIAWEVIPELAEAMIRAEIERVRQSARNE